MASCDLILAKNFGLIVGKHMTSLSVQVINKSRTDVNCPLMLVVCAHWSLKRNDKEIDRGHTKIRLFYSTSQIKSLYNNICMSKQDVCYNS